MDAFDQFLTSALTSDFFAGGIALGAFGRAAEPVLENEWASIEERVQEIRAEVGCIETGDDPTARRGEFG